MRAFALTVTALLVGGVLAVATPAAGATEPVSDIRATVVTSLPANDSRSGTHEFDRTNITYAHANASPEDVHVELAGGTLSSNFELEVGAAPGEQLSTGVSSSGDRDEGADAYLALQSRSCQNVRFVITDFQTSGGTVTRYDIRFQTNCKSLSQNYADIYGEVSYGYDEPSQPVVTGTRDIGWPSTPVGSRAPATIPVWLRNTGPEGERVGRPEFAGTADFPVASNDCASVLQPGESCRLTVAFVPRAAGVRRGSVTVRVGDTAVTTMLTGDAPPGETFLRLSGQRGEYVTEGRYHLFTDDRAPMTIGTGGAYRFDGNVTEISTDDDWGVRLLNRAAPMTLGTHAVDSGHDDTNYDLSVYGQGRGCNLRYGTVTIRQLTFTSEGIPATFDATFVQHCERPDSPALTGEIAYRAAPTAAAPIATKPVPPRPSAQTKPRVTRQPHNQSARFGHRARFRADATGRPAPSVTWQVTHDHGRHWQTLKHAVTRSLRVKLSRRNARYRYRARFTSSAGTTYTHAVQVRSRPRG